MDQQPVLTGIFIALAAGFIGFFFNIILDLFKSKTEKPEKEEDYLTVNAFNEHRKECCAIGLKREFVLCKQESCKNQATTENRLLTVEERLREGQVTFKELNEKMDEKFDSFGQKFDLVNQSLAGIHATLRYALENERRDNGI